MSLILVKYSNKILHMMGKKYTLDPEIPDRVILGEYWRRAVQLMRGYCRFNGPVFTAAGVQVRGRKYLKLGRFVNIERDVFIDAVSLQGVRIGARVKIGAYSIISSTSHFSQLGCGVVMGDDCGIGAFSFIGAAGPIEIGHGVIMGQYVSFHPQNHKFDDLDVAIQNQGTTSEGIRIGEGTWVGAKVTFLDGANVGAHSVVAAGAVVNKSFEPYSILAGVPARLVRKRDEIKP